MKKIVPKDAVLIPEKSKRVFKGEIYDTYQWPQPMFDGSKALFEMLKRPDTVSVIPIIDGKIMVIEDQQPHTGSKLSFPGGRVDSADPSTLDAAQREVREEIGYEFADWKLVKVWQPHSKLEWFIYFYIASKGRKVAQPHLDAGEKITPKLVTFDEVKSLVYKRQGHLGDSRDIFERVSNLEDLQAMPKYDGVEIER